ncbi:MAG: hypothetical protein K8S97_16980 [Anaerolineae bacterium]|nr:hypothetical protein [Anaerolineae bacterium]
MKRMITGRTMVLATLVLTLLLAACGTDELVQTAYTAAGDGSTPDSVTKTAAFHPQDDLNVVVELNTHRRELEIYAVFNAPNGGQYATNTLKADETVPFVLLGLDWETSGGEDWVLGEWSVDVFIDEERVITKTFDVLTDTPDTPDTTDGAE